MENSNHYANDPSDRVTQLKAEFDDFVKHNNQSHKEFYNRLEALDAHNKVQDAHYEHILEKLTEITGQLALLSTRISSLELKPVKRYDALVEKVLLTFAGGIIGYFLVKLGIG